MGVWGTGLYSGDFAADLRGAIAAVARLPFDGDKLAELLVQTEPGAANSAKDPDYSVFWLILADQFWKRGIASARVRETAMAILDEGADLAIMAGLGMDAAGLRARGKVLADLRARLAGPTPAVGPRAVLSKPQPLLLETGEVLVFPTERGNPINPYSASKQTIFGGWRQDGWGAAVIVETGRAFDFLAWYRPLRAPSAVPARPDLASLRARPGWTLARPGTTTRLHLRRMEFERIGSLPIDAAKLDRLFPDRPAGRVSAVSDISIANYLHLAVEGSPRPNYQPSRKIPTVEKLADICTGLSQP